MPLKRQWMTGASIGAEAPALGMRVAVASGQCFVWGSLRNNKIDFLWNGNANLATRQPFVLDWNFKSSAQGGVVYVEMSNLFPQQRAQAHRHCVHS